MARPLVLLLVIATATLGVVVAGCGDSGSDGKTTASAAKNDAPDSDSGGDDDTKDTSTVVGSVDVGKGDADSGPGTKNYTVYAKLVLNVPVGTSVSMHADKGSNCITGQSVLDVKTTKQPDEEGV